MAASGRMQYDYKQTNPLVEMQSSQPLLHLRLGMLTRGCCSGRGELVNRLNSKERREKEKA